MLKACLCLAAIGMSLKFNAYARIGETAQQSVERYGMETNLFKIIQEQDRLEVDILNWRQELNQVFELAKSDKKSLDPIIVAHALSDYERFKAIKDEINKLRTSGAYIQKQYVSKNFSGTNNLLLEGFDYFENVKRRLDEVEKLGREYETSSENPLAELVYPNRARETYFAAKNIYAKLAGHEANLQALKTKEESLQKKCRGEVLDPVRLEFERNGIKIYCYLKDNKTVAMIFLDDAFSESEVKQILENNSDSNSEWKETKPETSIDRQNWEVLMKYESADGRLEGLYGKYRVSEDDLGTMRGIYIGIKGIKEIDQESRVKDL